MVHSSMASFLDAHGDGQASEDQTNELYLSLLMLCFEIAFFEAKNLCLSHDLTVMRFGGAFTT